MNRLLRIGLIAGIVSGATVSAQAVTARDITVYKNADATELEVVVRNPTSQPRKDFIRMIEVQVDDAEPEVKKFNVQRGPTQAMRVPVSGLDTITAIRITATPRGGVPAEITITPLDILPAPAQ